MSKIGAVISELEGLNDVLWDAPGDPRLKPRSRSAVDSYLPTEQVSETPIIDADNLSVSDQDRWDEKKREVDRNLRSGTGIEALAWYSSFHENRRAWGIYIPLSSLPLMDELYFSRIKLAKERRLQLCWSILLHHELMHFAVDCGCAWMELLLKAPVRREFVTRGGSEPPVTGMSITDSYLTVEEAAANAHMLRVIGATESKATRRAVESFVTLQPAGYKDGINAVDENSFGQVIAETLRSYCAIWALDRRLDFGSPALQILRILPLEDAQLLAECPVHVIDDLDDVGVAPGSIKLIQCISEVVETLSFEKKLKDVPEEIQRDWSRVREQIKTHVPSPPRFEKLKNWKPQTCDCAFEMVTASTSRRPIGVPLLGEP